VRRVRSEDVEKKKLRELIDLTLDDIREIRYVLENRELWLKRTLRQVLGEEGVTNESS
jgi:hypothetical protein